MFSLTHVDAFQMTLVGLRPKNGLLSTRPSMVTFSPQSLWERLATTLPLARTMLWNVLDCESSGRFRSYSTSPQQPQLTNVFALVLTSCT